MESKSKSQSYPDGPSPMTAVTLSASDTPSRYTRRFLAAHTRELTVPVSLATHDALSNPASALTASSGSASSSSISTTPTTVPFALVISKVSNLRVPPRLKNAALPLAISVSVTLYNTRTRTFFGCTCSSPPSAEPLPNHVFAFHTSSFDESTVLVLELAAHGVSLGWTILPIFHSSRNIDGDFSSTTTLPKTHELPLQRGTPRALLLIEAGLDGLLASSKLVGASLSYAFMSYKAFLRHSKSVPANHILYAPTVGPRPSVREVTLSNVVIEPSVLTKLDQAVSSGLAPLVRAMAGTEDAARVPNSYVANRAMRVGVYVGRAVVHTVSMAVGDAKASSVTVDVPVGGLLILELECETVMPLHDGSSVQHRFVVSQWVLTTEGTLDATQAGISLLRPHVPILHVAVPIPLQLTVASGTLAMNVSMNASMMASAASDALPPPLPSASASASSMGAAAFPDSSKSSKKPPRDKNKKGDDELGGDEVVISSASATVERSERPGTSSMPTPIKKEKERDSSVPNTPRSTSMPANSVIVERLQRNESVVDASVLDPLPRHILKRFLAHEPFLDVSLKTPTLALPQPITSSDALLARQPHEFVLQILALQRNVPATELTSLGVVFEVQFWNFPRFSSQALKLDLVRDSFDPSLWLVQHASDAKRLGLEVRFTVAAMSTHVAALYAAYRNEGALTVDVYSRDRFLLDSYAIPLRDVLAPQFVSVRNELQIRLGFLRPSVGPTASVSPVEDVSEDSGASGSAPSVVVGTRVRDCVEGLYWDENPQLSNLMNASASQQHHGGVPAEEASTSFRGALHAQRWAFIKSRAAQGSYGSQEDVVKMGNDEIASLVIQAHKPSRIMEALERQFKRHVRLQTLGKGEREVNVHIKNPYGNHYVFTVQRADSQNAKEKDEATLLLGPHESGSVLVKTSSSTVYRVRDPLQRVLCEYHVDIDALPPVELTCREVVLDLAAPCTLSIPVRHLPHANSNNNAPPQVECDFPDTVVAVGNASHATASSFDLSVRIKPPPLSSNVWTPRFLFHSAMVPIQLGPYAVVHVNLLAPTLSRAIVGTVGQTSTDQIMLPVSTLPATRLVRATTQPVSFAPSASSGSNSSTSQNSNSNSNNNNDRSSTVSMASAFRVASAEAFFWSPGQAPTIDVLFRPTVPGTTDVAVHVTDVEADELLAVLLFRCGAQMPPITKTFELQIPFVRPADAHSLPPGAEAPPRGVSKKVAYKNPYPQARNFHIASSDYSVVEVKESVLQVAAREKEYVHMLFPYGIPGGRTSATAYVFINDEMDRNEECLCVKIEYV